MRALIVEDEPELARLLAKIVGGIGLVSDWANGLAVARDYLESGEYQILLIDRRLPDGDGLDLVRHVSTRSPAPVIAITAADGISDRVDGLDAGLEDYIVKPFDALELAARIRVALRRSPKVALPPLVLGRLSLDISERAFAIDGDPLILSRREFAALETLINRSGRVVLRETLWRHAYGEQDAFQESALDTLISRLRRRLAGAVCRIVTVRGVGYMLTAEVSNS